MSLGYTEVGDGFLIPSGTRVEIQVGYNNIPFTAPGQDEWTRALSEYSVFTLEAFEVQIGLGESVAILRGRIWQADQAGTLRGEVQAAVQAINDNRAADLFMVTVYPIGVDSAVAPDPGGLSGIIAALTKALTNPVGLGFGVTLALVLVAYLALRK